MQVKVITPKHEYWDEIMEFGYIKVSEYAKAPEKINGNACYDLAFAAPVDSFITMHPGERAMFSTGLILIFPLGFHGFILPRSGLSWKHGIDVMAGVIDNSYELETKIILINHSKEIYTIRGGDRIAQIELRKDVSFPVKEMSMENLRRTNRGAGFGSSGS